MQVVFKVKLPVKVKKERKRFVSFCPILDVWSQGESHDKAIHNLQDALSLFFTSCYERGTLNQVLKNCGFKQIERRVIKHQPFPKRFESVEIPIPFQIPPKANPEECHV